MKKIGLVLSGGGLRGLAHIGALKELENLNFKFNAISGTSAGGIVGALYASGQKANHLEKAVLKKKLLDFFDFSFCKKGLRNTNKLKEFIFEITNSNNFEDLKIPLFINATNITEAKQEIFSSGNLFQAIRASISIPGIFEPLKINNNYYVDGGILDNNPFSILPSDIEKIVVINVSPIKKINDAKNLKISTLLENSYKIMQNEITKLKLSKLQDKNIIILEPKVGDYRMFTKQKYFKEIINKGKEEVKKRASELKELKQK